MSDTIFALGSGPAPAGVAVIRISGPAARVALAALSPDAAIPEPRHAALRPLVDPTDPDVMLDSALVLWFPAPASFTGEDVVELHCHGGAATIAAVLSALGTVAGCRLAQAGEFTRRAFGHGRLDLTEVEGLADLIAAETEAQRRLALRLASGDGRDRYQGWTDRLVRVLATIEAAVDFPEDDLPEQMLDRNEIEIKRLVDEWTHNIDLGSRSAGIRDGVRIAIVGAPNVGKSSLLNAIAGRDAAIVSEIAGTTRDVIEVRIDLGGYAVTLSDTAGVRESQDVIERQGVERALAAAEAADLILYLYEAGTPVDQDFLSRFADRGDDVFMVRSKADLANSIESVAGSEDRTYAVSSVTGSGISNLLSSLGAACAERYGVAAGAVAVRQRHRDSLQRACTALQQSLGQPELALAGEDVRVALAEMGRITGRVDVESVLDVVFAEFCIGK